MRTTRPQMFIEIASVVARRSTCMRLNVGAVIVKDRTIVSIGYNGSPSGEAHCSGNSCPGRMSCAETIHAEANALAHLPAGIEGPLDLYVTDSPCPTCYDKMINDGRVQRIFFQTPYRITEHLENSLWGSVIDIYRVMPAGYVMEWASKELVDVAT